jgi:hypothetical protein
MHEHKATGFLAKLTLGTLLAPCIGGIACIRHATLPWLVVDRDVD